MPQISFTVNIQRHIACPSAEVSGSTAREALEEYFATNAAARGYVLDEQGALRKHMAVFINGSPIRDRKELSDTIEDGARIDVMQALSGG